MKENLVSVLTPVYNGEAYVSRLLDSVLNQTYPEIEMILSDDGSADDTVKLASAYISRFKEKGYSLKIISSPHKNASAAISAGLCHVNGAYLVWPDADDELLPDSIAARVRFLELHPDCRCVRSVMDYVSDETGERVRLQEQLGDLTREDLFWDILEGRSFVCCGCYMLKTEDFFQIYPSKRIPECGEGQNFQILLPFLSRHRCPTIPDALYRVHIREDSHSRKARTEADEKYRAGCFSSLLDELLETGAIKKTPDVVDRISLWKLSQRKRIARHYCHLVQFECYQAMALGLRLKRSLRRLWRSMISHP